MDGESHLPKQTVDNLWTTFGVAFGQRWFQTYPQVIHSGIFATKLSTGYPQLMHRLLTELYTTYAQDIHNLSTELSLV